jgi:hypothetical protein
MSPVTAGIRCYLCLGKDTTIFKVGHRPIRARDYVHLNMNVGTFQFRATLTGEELAGEWSSAIGLKGRWHGKKSSAQVLH